MNRPPLPSTYRQSRHSGLILPSSLDNQLRLEAAAEFRAAASNRLRAGWNLGRTHPTPANWTLQRLREYTRDLNRNDPIAAGATDTLGINIVGRGLQPQSQLRAERLGISKDRARELQRQAESIWEIWNPLADSGNRLSFDELQFLALTSVITDGEVLALPVWCDDPWRPLGRAVELLEADRLTTVGAQTITGKECGIDVGPRGEPTFYNFTKIDPTKGIAQFGGGTERIAARDDQGRPRVLHLFRSKRPGEMRGYPLFTPAITLFQDLADGIEAKVVAYKAAACMAVFITQTAAYGGAPAVTGQETNPARNLEDLEPGEVRYLNVGESIEVVDSKKSAEDFAVFVEQVQRIIGVPIGLPYELSAKNFSKTNYSSARAALLEARRTFMYWRFWLATKFCQPNWDLVLEEAMLRGLWEVRPRDFYANRTEYLRASWMGGGWGWVDPVKEVGASIAAILAGLSTHTKELAAQGEDFEEIFETLAREQEFAAGLGLTFAAPKTAIPASSKGDEDKAAGSQENMVLALKLLAQLDRPEPEQPAGGE
jgi:lambda family phage portal protein